MNPIYIEPADEEARRYREALLQQYKKAPQYHNAGFCSHSQLEPEFLSIELLCSKNNLGRVLLKQAEIKALETRLKSWYKSLGFKCTLKAQCHFMRKIL